MKKKKILAKFEAQDSGQWFRSFVVQQKTQPKLTELNAEVVNIFGYLCLK